MAAIVYPESMDEDARKHAEEVRKEWMMKVHPSFFRNNDGTSDGKDDGKLDAVVVCSTSISELVDLYLSGQTKEFEKHVKHLGEELVLLPGPHSVDMTLLFGDILQDQAISYAGDNVKKFALHMDEYMRRDMHRVNNLLHKAIPVLPKRKKSNGAGDDNREIIVTMLSILFQEVETLHMSGLEEKIRSIAVSVVEGPDQERKDAAVVGQRAKVLRYFGRLVIAEAEQMSKARLLPYKPPTPPLPNPFHS
jgi:hypothetical protein